MADTSDGIFLTSGFVSIGDDDRLFWDAVTGSKPNVRERSESEGDSRVTNCGEKEQNRQTSKVRGVISGIPTSVTMVEIMESLKEHDVIEANRLTRGKEKRKLIYSTML